MNKEECISIIKTEKVGYLATCDKAFQPYARPIDMGTVYGGCIYFATFDNTDKIGQLNQVKNVEAIFIHNYSQLRIEGIAEKVENTEIIDRFMNDNKSISEMNEKSVDSKLILYCIKPQKVKYMGADDKTYTFISWE